MLLCISRLVYNRSLHPVNCIRCTTNSECAFCANIEKLVTKIDSHSKIANKTEGTLTKAFHCVIELFCDQIR